MTDVEKYGVFALVFVMGVLGLIVFYEPDSGQRSAAAGGRSVIIRSAADVPLAAGVAAQRTPGRGASSGALAAGSKQVSNQASNRAGRLSSRNGQAPANSPARFRVKSPADGAGEFSFTEPPLRYPGERTSLGRAGADGTIVHVVRKGETLSDISKSYYGTSSRHREIEALNPGLKPKKMRPGDEVIVSLPPPAGGNSRTAQNGIGNGIGIDNASQEGTAIALGSPSPGGSSSQPSQTGRTYVVQKGDTLGQIAQRLLGTVKRVDDLFAANKGVLDSPHDLKIGMELSIPPMRTN